MSGQLERAIKLLNAGQREEARRLCEQLRQIDGDRPEVMHLVGVIAAQENRADEAIEWFQKALARQPKWPEALCNLAAVFRSLGQFDASKEQLFLALRHDPGYARAFFFLSQIDTYRDRELVEQILEVLATPPLPLPDQCLLHFAVGKLCDDLGSFDEAFYHYELGNVARQARFDPVGHRALIDRLMRATEEAAAAGRLASAVPSRRPIFIVGMPRSGTSLIEQILSSHPVVHGAGELPDIPSISHALPRHAAGNQEYPECLPQLTDRVLAGFAEAYLKRLDQVTPDGHIKVVDKNPGNFMHIGLIAHMFPEAAIVHCQRAPLSTCLSCYFQNFASHHDYAFHQTHLGFYYAEYKRLMQHWRDVFPERFLDFSYEQLISEPDKATRELLRWCDLPWDDRCLRPHQTLRQVTTASAWEVRQPIYTSSLQRWRNYERHLGPLMNAMDQAVPRPSP